jgi:hypothetical protein
MKYTVYRTTNVVNHKIYVGVHKTDGSPDNYIGSGDALKRSIRKYGKHNFSKEILFEYDTPEEAFGMERIIVDADFVARTDTYNLTIGGHGSMSNNNSTGRPKGTPSKYKGKTYDEIYTPEYAAIKRELLSKARTGVASPMKGIRHSEESKEKMSRSIRSNPRIFAEEDRRVMSEQRTGRKHKPHKPRTAKNKGDYAGDKNSQFGMCWVMNHDTKENRKCTQEELESYTSTGWVKGFKMMYFPKKENHNAL